VAHSHQEKQSRDRKQPNPYSRITHFDRTTPLVESSKVCRTVCRQAAGGRPRPTDSFNGFMTVPR
jgi:hypothetical protein